MPKKKLQVAVFGDSVMWGQGLLDKDKFYRKATKAISQLLGRQGDVVVMSARSGAAIKASANEIDAQTLRREFVDTYPTIFVPSSKISDFVANDIQEAARSLYGEIPSTFPTIEYQVESVPSQTAQTINLVLITGGANDINFEDVLNPENHAGDFIQHYAPRFEEVFYSRVKKLLIQVRKKFPNAVIMYTGYYSAFARGMSNGAIKDLFYEIKNVSDGKRWFNENVWQDTDVDRLVGEGQIRSEFGCASAMYWSKRAISELNADPTLQGLGFIFVHPQFRAENTIFAENSYVHRNYIISKVKDKAKKIRRDTCPRSQSVNEMKQFLSLTNLVLPGVPVPLSVIQNLRNSLDGPTSLLKALDRLIDATSNHDRLEKVRAVLSKDVDRIADTLRASVFHPNERGAQQYANNIVQLFDKQQNVSLRSIMEDISSVNGAAKLTGVRESLKQYGLETQTSLRAISQLTTIDSIAVEIVTAQDSASAMFDFFSLDLGEGDHYLLSFLPSVLRPNLSFVVENARFEPGKRSFIPLDASGIRLNTISRMVLERKALPPIQIGPNELSISSSEPWKPTELTLFINGIKVFHQNTSMQPLERNGKLSFSYPFENGG